MGIELEGFDELQDEFKRLEKRAQELHGEHEVGLADLFNPQFMADQTEFGDIEEMFEASGLNVDNQEEFEQAIATPEWDEFVASHTRFENWSDMRNQAALDWMESQLSK